MKLANSRTIKCTYTNLRSYANPECRKLLINSLALPVAHFNNKLVDSYQGTVVSKR
jgi:hypothetical protein